VPDYSENWFKINRKIFESDLWIHRDKARVFIYLVGMARYKDEPNTKYKDSGVIIERGQYLRSYRKIITDLEYIENNAVKYYSLSQISRIIKDLEEEGRVTTEDTKLGTLFTVCNYDRYQKVCSNNDELGTQLERSWNGDGTQLEQYSKNVKKGVRREKESAPSNEPKFDEDSRPLRAALYLRKLILNNNPRQPVPDPNPNALEDWAKELDRLNRLGPVGAKDKGYSWSEIKDLMTWCQDDSFWQTNILSASKFREKITTLEMQMKGASKGSTGANEKPTAPKKTVDDLEAEGWT